LKILKKYKRSCLFFLLDKNGFFAPNDKIKTSS
jgi:hypothetical protein